MKLLFSALFSLFFFVLHASGSMDKGPIDDWVNKVKCDCQKKVEEAGAYHYMLIDKQDNIALETAYRHFAIKILNSEGIQSMSDISVDYDPSYQSLRFNLLQIIRSGKTIDKLHQTEVKTIQRETNMDRNLYDGSLSAVLNISDVREGDVIEYAYTLKGFNPIQRGHYSNTFYHQFSLPVTRILSRVVSRKRLSIKTYNGASDPKLSQIENGQIEYLWDIPADDMILYDNNVPAWVDLQKKVSLSTFENWNEVVQWAKPLYTYDKEAASVIARSIKVNGEGEKRILGIIRMVQDDIRYLGFESGIGAYKPNPPSKIFEQRFGDCKDKSLLLVSLLREEGLSSFPVLVNTKIKKEVSDLLPATGAFDHCIVNFSYKGNDYFVDPTMSHQGGKLNDLSLPDYGKGLLIDESVGGLVDIPKQDDSRLKIHELLDVEGIGGDADWVIRSEYHGQMADFQRSFFKTNSLEYIEKEYLNYYSSLYPGIELAGGIKFMDNSRNSENVVIVEEEYSIKDFWTSSSSGVEGQIEALLYPLVLASKIEYTKSADRQMPYFLGNPYVFEQITDVSLPEVWNFENINDKIEGDGFTYTSSKKGNGRNLRVLYSYDLTKEYIHGDSVRHFLKQHEEIKDSLSYYLTYNMGAATFKLSWFSIMLAVLTLGICSYFGLRVYKTYDPVPWKYAMDIPIGAWLILPAIGLTISPITMLISIIKTPELFNQQTWLSQLSLGIESIDVLFLIVLEIVYNFSILFLSVFLVVLFYQRRTSVPLIATIFYVLNFLAPLLDAFFVDIVLGGEDTAFDDDTIKSAVRTFFGMVIWIPYFNFSERSKNTFCKQYKK